MHTSLQKCNIFSYDVCHVLQIHVLHFHVRHFQSTQLYIPDSGIDEMCMCVHVCVCMSVCLDCGMTVYSNAADRSGQITSPNYPNRYGANLRCLYHLIGQSNERVQLVFDEFEVKGVLPRYDIIL